MNTPSARDILKAQIKEKNRQGKLIHEGFGHFAYLALLREHNALINNLVSGEGVSARRIDKFIKNIANSEISEIDGSWFRITGIGFWKNELMRKKHNRKPYDLNYEIPPLEKMMK